MSTPIAEVLAVRGEAFARDADGNMRALKEGDTLNAGEVVVTQGGASVELDFGNGETMMVSENQSVVMNSELASAMVPELADGEVMDPTLASVLAALEGDGDLLDELDATAAGAGGGEGGEGGGFVSLLRVNETVDGVELGTLPAAAIAGAPVLFSEDVLPPEEDELLATVGDDDDDDTIGDDDDDTIGDDDDDTIGDDDDDTIGDDDDDTIGDDDDDTIGDDDDDTIGDDDDDTVGDDDDDSSIGFDVLAQSGQGQNAWTAESGWNINQFNAHATDTDGGYGVAPNANANAATNPALNSNETLLFKLEEGASEVSLTINPNTDDAGLQGSIHYYDVNKEWLGQTDFSEAGEYGLISDEANIGYIIVTGAGSDNGDGFYVQLEASATVENGYEDNIMGNGYDDVIILDPDVE